MTGFWGLALSEMPHRLQVDALYGWCAWDTLFIPLILGKEAHVESPCATTGEIVSLTVGPDGVRDVAPDVDLVQAIARPYIYEENPRGTLGIVVDRERDVLLGAWAVAPLAAEWIHVAVLAIRAEVPLAVLEDTIPQSPTYSEGYLSALRGIPA